MPNSLPHPLAEEGMEWDSSATAKYYTGHCTNTALSKRDSCLQSPRMHKAGRGASLPFSKVCLSFYKQILNNKSATIYFS